MLQTTKVRITDDRRGIVARRVVAAERQADGKTLYLGQSDNAEERYCAAGELGFDYVPAWELLQRPAAHSSLASKP